MTKDVQQFDEEFVRLALAIDEHMPGYVDSYFGPQGWAHEVKQAGKRPLPELIERTSQLAVRVSQANGMDAQRKDFLARQISAMQMSLRLLTGERCQWLKKLRHFMIYSLPGRMNPTLKMLTNDWINFFPEKVRSKNALKTGINLLKSPLRKQKTFSPL